jgi:glucose-1-phosphate adenylyltransferase
MFRIIDFTLANCLRSGVRRVSLLTQYRHEELHRQVGRSWSLYWDTIDSASLRFLPPTSGKRYQGTADAVFQNLELLETENPDFVLVLSADHIYQMDYSGLIQRHAETNADLTVATVEHPVHDSSSFGVVEVDDQHKVTRFEEKPLNPGAPKTQPTVARVNMGVYLFKRKVLSSALRFHCDIGSRYDFGRDVIPSLIGPSQTYAYDFRDENRNVPGYWRDIGTLQSYYDANMELLRRDLPTVVNQPGDWSQSTWAGRLDSSCQIVRTIISPSVHVGRDVSVEDSILMPGVRVGEGARLRRTIVEEGVSIPPGFRAGFDLRYDCSHHTVTEAGVVVVTQPGSEQRPTVVHFAARNLRKNTRKGPERDQGMRLRALA